MDAPAISATQILLLALAGVVGVLLRFAADQIALRMEIQPYLGTFTVNILGCFLAGALYSLMNKGVLAGGGAQILLVGLCGGFTTFSAYALQSITLIQASAVPTAVAYLVLSPLVGIGAAALGCSLFR